MYIYSYSRELEITSHVYSYSVYIAISLYRSWPRMIPHFSITSMLKLLIFGLAGIHADPINPQSECRGTEVCPLPYDTETFDINCNCGGDSQCHWVTFANPRRALTNGSLLSWHRSTTGYGQFRCNSLNGTTIRNVLILPAAGGEGRGL